MPKGAAPIRPWRGVENKVKPHAGIQILPREQPDKRPAAGQHRPSRRNETRRFQQDLRAARAHHAGQRPAWNWERPLDRAGRQDDARRPNLPRDAADRDRNLVLTQQSPYGGARHIVRAAGESAAHQRFTAPIIVAEHRIAGKRRARDAAINLAARMLLLVQQHAAKPGARAKSAGSKSRWTCSNNRHVVAVAQLVRCDHVPNCRLPD